MPENLIRKIIAKHRVEGEMLPGAEIALRIDQTLTQDATGTLAYLQFEAMGISRVKTELSVSYIDHNTLQAGFENADDHRYLQSVAAKYGVVFSRPGNGICHQVHLERFAAPGKTLLGSDSHTPTAGGIGSLAIGAGGLDVAVAMGGGPFHLPMPSIIGVKLTGKLPRWSSAKDVILELLRRLGVRGGVGKALEFFGPGIASLEVPQRATITNMGAELGATASVFPADGVTQAYLRYQGRVKDYSPWAADEGASYDETMELDLSSIVPLIARPHSPGSVVPVKEAAGTKVDQVIIGSCTNSSLRDLTTAAKILAGGHAHPDVSLAIAPGSRQVLAALAKSGALASLVEAGARILESACGPCIGMGQAPSTDGVSVRTFNRNFEGRSGTCSAKVYLASVETAALAALKGKIVDPQRSGLPPVVRLPKEAAIDDSMFIRPSKKSASVEIVRGPNIRPLPELARLPDTLRLSVILKTGDNVTTDHIMPAGAKILPLRSNIPALSEHSFAPIDPGFSERARRSGGGFIVGGDKYGQGSSREHAAIVPRALGVAAVLAKSFARIHRTNLVNVGILPLVLADPAAYVMLEPGDLLVMGSLREGVRAAGALAVRNETKGTAFSVRIDLSKRERRILLAGGLLNDTRRSAGRPSH